MGPIPAGITATQDACEKKEKCRLDQSLSWIRHCQLCFRSEVQLFVAHSHYSEMMLLFAHKPAKVSSNGRRFLLECDPRLGHDYPVRGHSFPCFGQPLTIHGVV